MVKIYKQPFAHDGDAIAIPDASQPDGKMSSADGWTPDYQLPKTDPNYKPVGRQEMNGVFKEVTESLGEIQQFGFAKWQPMLWPQGARVVEGDVVYRALTQTSQQPPHADWIDDMDALILELGTAATRDATVGNADVTGGRLLKVGDLGSNFHTLEVIDFNGLPELYPYSGMVPVMSDVGSINAPPKGAYFHVFQTFGEYGNVTQFAIPFRADVEGFFLRTKYGGVWSQWLEVLSTGNILTTTGQSTQYPMSQKAVTDALFGVGQAWQDVAGSRVAGTTYTNSTGKPIFVSITARETNSISKLYVDGVITAQGFLNGTAYFIDQPLQTIVPNGSEYYLKSTGESNQISLWAELR